jgi:carboxylesterase type B
MAHLVGLTFGFADQYDGGWISTEGNVIIVTINYRMNLFGFLSVGHPASKGNYGLWDQKKISNPLTFYVV